METSSQVTIPRIDINRPERSSEEALAGLREGSSRRNPDFAEMMKVVSTRSSADSEIGRRRFEMLKGYDDQVRAAETYAAAKLFMGSSSQDTGLIPTMHSEFYKLVDATQKLNDEQWANVMGKVASIYRSNENVPGASLSFKRSDGVGVTVDARFNINPTTRIAESISARITEVDEEGAGGSVGVELPFTIIENRADLDTKRARVINPEGTKSKATFSQAVEEIVGASNTAAGLFEIEASKAWQNIEVNNKGKENSSDL